ncbi:MAG: hypothetical protein GXP24_14205 [Planctomycetes bacterium]|nr:hypothetical protein [Planctomycetota bacterium]
MNHSNILRLSCIILLICLSSSSTCNAGLIDLVAWTHEYYDGQYVLVMVPSDEEYRLEWTNSEEEGTWEEDWKETEEGREAKRLRSLYPVNGLYHNDGTFKIVWEFSSWTYGRPYLSKDGRYAVFPGVWSEESTLSNPGWRADVANFSVDGRIVATYNFLDLISFPWIKQYITQQYLNCEQETFDADELTYTVETRWGERVVFDITTGKIIEHNRPVEMVIGILIAILTLTSIGYSFWKNRLKKTIKA